MDGWMDGVSKQASEQAPSSRRGAYLLYVRHRAGVWYHLDQARCYVGCGAAIAAHLQVEASRLPQLYSCIIANTYFCYERIRVTEYCSSGLLAGHHPRVRCS